jgi:predicted ArsR family transcriptional regulator
MISADFGSGCYFSAMHQDRAVHAERPASKAAATHHGGSTSTPATPAPPPAIPSPAAVAAAFPGAPFEHGTDAELIERRVRTANPLMTASPGPGASSTLRREVLYALRTGGPASPDQVAERVGASRTGVLQQLRTLESAGLVSRSLSRHGVGRPRHVYDLTPGAQELFPANYGALTQSVLAAVHTVGGDELIAQVFEARREMLRARVLRRFEKLPPNASLWEKAKEVARYQDETGYLGRAMLEPDGTVHLSEHNCAIFAVSGMYPIACEAELQLIAEVLGAKVTRECHILTGARSCTYRIEPIEDSATG